MTKSGHVFTPVKTVNYESLVALSYQNADGVNFEDAPVSVYILATFPIPKSTSKKKLSDIIREKVFPTKKPDCDNIAKAVCDALNGVAWRDDSQVVELSVAKRYTQYQPTVHVTIEELPDDH